MSHLMRAQRGFFVRGQLGTSQNELIASTSLWTTDSPPVGVPPHSAENGKLQFCHFRHQQGRRKVTLRLVAGDFHAVVDFRASASQVDLLVKVSGVSIERNILQTLHVVQSGSKNCACGIATGTPSNCGNFTVSCADTTVIDVTCLSEATERLTDCTCGTPLHSTTGTSTTLSKNMHDSGPTVAATTRYSKWRHDAGVVGSLPFAQWGHWAPAPFRTDAVHAGLRVLLLVAVRTQSLWDASPGVMSQPPWSLGRFSGRRPCARSAIARDR